MSADGMGAPPGNAPASDPGDRRPTAERHRQEGSASTVPDRTERADRITLARRASARSLMCPAQWSGGWALANAGVHRNASGHVVVGRYAAEYLWFPPDGGERHG